MKHCIACKAKLPKKCLFELNQAPASAQNIPDAQEVKADRGMDLGLYRCDRCGLVQFACEPVDYYRDVIRAGGFSSTMTELRRRQYRHLIETYHLEGKRFLEVGCGQGEFLKVLTEFPVEAFGMEHREDLVRLAADKGLRVWREFPETAEQVFAEGPFDVFLSFNFLEHQPRPDVMLQAIYHNLTDDGMGLVTVPSLEYILEQGSYYELIRDHIAYYSFDTLKGLLERNGFAVLEEEMINRDTISMIVRKRPAGAEAGGGATGDRATSGRETSGGETDGMESGDEAAGGRQRDGRNAAANVREGTVLGEPSVDVLTEGYRIVTEEIQKLLADLEREGRTLAIWGASHQGFTLAATTGLGRRAVYIIDSAPFKQGRFAPASHLPIVSPEDAAEHPADAILIVAPGYTDEIAGIIRQRFDEGTEIMTLRTNHIERL